MNFKSNKNKIVVTDPITESRNLSDTCVEPSRDDNGGPLDDGFKGVQGFTGYYQYGFPWSYSEGKILAQLEEYLKSTYGAHYVSKLGSGTLDRIQVMDLIGSVPEAAIEFARGCVLKYAYRYGKKDGFNEKDIFKAIHYLIFMLHFSRKCATIESTENK